MIFRTHSTLLWQRSVIICKFFPEFIDFFARIQFRTSSNSIVLHVYWYKNEKPRVGKTLHTRKYHQDKFIGFGLDKSLAVGSKLPLKIDLGGEREF